jgi:hypothetical protein
VAKTIPNNPYEAMLLNTGPVPGESLTVAPKTLPCEKPPQYPRLEDALQYSWEALVDRTDKIVALAKLGMSLRDQCQRFLMEGFTRGLWSVDMLILMGHPVLAMIRRGSGTYEHRQGTCGEGERGECRWRSGCGGASGSSNACAGERPRRAKRPDPAISPSGRRADGRRRGVMIWLVV